MITQGAEQRVMERKAVRILGNKREEIGVRDGDISRVTYVRVVDGPPNAYMGRVLNLVTGPEMKVVVVKNAIFYVIKDATNRPGDDIYRIVYYTFYEYRQDENGKLSPCQYSGKPSGGLNVNINERTARSFEIGMNHFIDQMKHFICTGEFRQDHNPLIGFTMVSRASPPAPVRHAVLPAQEAQLVPFSYGPVGYATGSEDNRRSDSQSVEVLDITPNDRALDRLAEEDPTSPLNDMEQQLPSISSLSQTVVYMMAVLLVAMCFRDWDSEYSLPYVNLFQEGPVFTWLVLVIGVRCMAYCPGTHVNTSRTFAAITLYIVGCTAFRVLSVSFIGQDISPTFFQSALYNIVLFGITGFHFRNHVYDVGHTISLQL